MVAKKLRKAWKMLSASAPPWLIVAISTCVLGSLRTQQDSSSKQGTKGAVRLTQMAFCDRHSAMHGHSYIHVQIGKRLWQREYELPLQSYRMVVA